MAMIASVETGKRVCCRHVLLTLEELVDYKRQERDGLQSSIVRVVKCAGIKEIMPRHGHLFDYSHVLLKRSWDSRR